MSTDDTSNTPPPEGYEYVYCRFRRCGKRTLDAHAYGLKAWRLCIKIKKED